MSQAVAVSYKELQKEAKRCGIPANMKRSFLESAIEAFVENDREKLHSIVEYHKSQRKRRASTIKRPAKDFTKLQASENARKVAVAGSPVQASSCSSRERFYELSDDDDSSNFHPDSTSTPNCSSPIVNLNHYPSDFSSQYRANDVRAACNLSYYRQSSVHSPSFPRIEAQPGVYHTNAVAVNFDFAQQNCHSIQTARSNSRYLGINDDTVPVSATYEHTPVVDIQVEYPSYTPCAIEKQCSSYCSPNVPRLNDDVEKNSIPLEASRLLNVAVVDNFRNSPVHSASSITRSRVSDHFTGNIADAASVNAEFDSDSDTETLSLTDEIVNFFDPRVVNRRISFTASDAAPVFSRSDLNASSSILRNRSVFGNSNEVTTWDNCVKERSWDAGAASLPSQRVQSSNVTLGGYNSLPSISTLLPEYKIQAYSREHHESSQQYYELTQPYNAYYLQADRGDGTPISDWSQSSEAKNKAKLSSIPYLDANSDHYSNDAASRLPADSSVSSSAIEELAVPLNFISPFDVFNEAMVEMQKCNANTAQSSNRLLSKTSKPTTREAFLSEQRTTRLVLKHETIPIQALTTDNDTKNHVYRKSLETETNKPAEKSIAMSTVCRNTTLVLPASVAGSFRANTLTDSESSYRSCKNEVYGCNIIISNEELARVHEKECLHQVVHCPSDECNWCGVVRALTDHIYECHTSQLRVGNDLVYVINRSGKDAPFTTYFQLHEGTIFVITVHVNEKKCVATMQYLPEIETADHRNNCIKGTMQLVYFTGRVDMKCWKGIVRPYFENDKALYQKGNILQSAIGLSKNVVIRVLID